MFFNHSPTIDRKKSHGQGGTLSSIPCRIWCIAQSSKEARLNSKRDDAEVLFQEAEVVQEHLQENVATEVENCNEAKTIELKATTTYNLAMARQIVENIIIDLWMVNKKKFYQQYLVIVCLCFVSWQITNAYLYV